MKYNLTKILIGVLMIYFAATLVLILTSSTPKPQTVTVSPALKLEPQASFPAGELGMIIYHVDGKFYGYSYSGWEELKTD